MIISILFFYNSLQRIYLFDSSIIYNYAYLMSINYKPFTDFTTPLLPGIGLIQLLAYKVFGFNYLSGVFMAYIFLTTQYIILNIILKLILKEKLISNIFTFTITLTGVTIIGNLYYNHILISLSTIFFLTNYYYLKNESSSFYKLFLFFIISFFVVVKIHWGIVLFLLQFFFDFYIKDSWLPKKNIVNIYLLGTTLIVLICCFVFYCSNNTLIQDYLINVSGLTILGNINFKGLLLFFNIPYNIFSTLNITPFTLFFTFFIIPGLTSKKRELLKSAEFKVAIAIVLFCFIITLNSLESFSIFLPLQIVLILLGGLYLQKLETDNHLKISKIIVLSMLFLHLLFGLAYVINGNRKIYNEANGTFGNIKFSFKPIQYKLNDIKTASFFKGIYLSNSQTITFNYINSVIKKSSSNKIFFGPELEIFNVIYKNKPIIGFPLWVHPGLTLNKAQTEILTQRIVENNYDLIFVSKKRKQFFPQLEPILFSNNYILLENKDDLNFVDCYLKSN